MMIKAVSNIQKSHLVQSLHHSHNIVEDNNGLALAQSLLFDDVMLQIDKVGRLVAEVVGAETVEHQADSPLHLSHFVGLHIFHDFIGTVLKKRQDMFKPTVIVEKNSA